jgi:hypothetical protein
MDTAIRLLSGKQRVEPKANEALGSLLFRSSLSLFLIFAFHLSAYQGSEASGEGAKQCSISYPGAGEAIATPLRRTVSRDGSDAVPGTVHSSDITYREVMRTALSRGLGLREKWHAIAYQAKTSQTLQLTDYPAQLCFVCEHPEVPQTCFLANSEQFHHQFVDELSVVSIYRKMFPRQGLLFIARFHGGGSGTRSLITLWVYDEDAKKFVNILPEITISELGAYKLLVESNGGIDGVLVVADYMWGEKETHWDPHRYSVKIYQYDQKQRTFKPVCRPGFVTEEKYEYSDKDSIFDRHMNKIKECLK